MSGARAAAATWRGPLRPLEWVAIFVTVLGIGWTLAAPLLLPAGPTCAPVRSLVRVEQLANGQSVARVDDAALAAAFADAGLPDPPALDGVDPVPLGAVVARYDRWCATGESSALMDLGRIWIALDEHDEALACFAAAAARAPDAAEPIYLVGVEAQTLGIDDLADSALREAARLEPGAVTTFARLGRLAIQRGDLEQAQAHFEHARANAPNLSLGHVGLGRVALARGDGAAATQHLLEAVRVTPNDFRAFRFLGQALAATGRSEDARRAIRHAEEMPQYSGWLTFDERLKAAHAMANTQRHLENSIRAARGAGDGESVVRHAAALLKRRPRDTGTMGVLAATLIQMKRLDEARSVVDRAVEIAPRSAEMRCVSAQVWMLKGDQARALAEVDEAIAIEATSATAWDIRGRVCFLAKRYDEAFAAMDQSIALEPGNVNRLFAMGVMCQEVQRYERAGEAYRAVLAIRPDHGPARSRLEQLPDP